VSKQAAEAAQRGVGGVVLGGALASAPAGRCLGATGLSRWGGCSSANVIGAQALRRCQASIQISTWARTRSVEAVVDGAQWATRACRRYLGRAAAGGRCRLRGVATLTGWRTGSTGVCSLVGDP
jgi:hypothetical protein